MRGMDKENFMNIIISIILRENGKIIIYMDKEYLLIFMATNMKVNGMMVNGMVKVNSF